MALHLGLKLYGFVRDGGAMAAVARRAEAIGLHSLWFSETLTTARGKPRPYRPNLQPWPVLAYLAAVTDRIHLGTSVAIGPLWHPVLLAGELATLDQLSRGRLIVGLGAGWRREDFAALGIPWETRGKRLSELVRALRHLWAGSEEPFEGDFFRFDGVEVLAPYTPGGPPILIGATAPPALRRAARIADGITTTNAEPGTVEAARAAINDVRVAAGAGGDFQLWVQTGLPPTLPELEERLAALEAAGASGVIFQESKSSLDTDEALARLDVLAEYGRAHAAEPV